MMGNAREMLVRGVITLALGFLVTACAPTSQPPKAEEGASTAKEKPQYGGTYRFFTSNPSIGQDPHRTTGTSHFQNFGQAYSNLLRYKFSPGISEATFIIAPELVEKWENTDPTTWVLHLQKGIKWHNIPPVNGREFVAADVVYSINRLAAPDGAQSGYWLSLAKIEAQDKYTVKVTLKEPSAPFLSTIAFGFNKMVAREAVEAGGGNLNKGPLIGTGAWLVTCTVDIECVFKRNPEFFLKDDEGNQLPYLDSMRGLVINDVQAVLAAFRAKQLDATSLVAEDRAVVQRAHPEVLIKETKSFGGQLFHFRNDKAPWKDERVRMAVSKAIDRQEIIDTILSGKGWFQLAWANPGDDWFLPQEEFKQAYRQDIDLAKKLLAEAGYSNGFDASLWCANYGVDYTPTCELLASQMAKAGIRIKINVHDRPTYLSQVFIRDGKFEDLAYGPQGTYAEPDLWLSTYYHSKGGRNSGYINDPKLDEMIDAQRRELNEEKRKQLILDFQRYLLQKNRQLVLFSPITQNALWPWVKNRLFSAGGDYPANRYQEYIWIDQDLKKKMGAPE